MKKECVVLVYNSFGDPLFRNLMYQYILDLVAQTGWKFHLITYEQPAFVIKNKDQLTEELNRKGIYWYPKSHRTGRFLLAKKIIDFLSSIFLVAKLRINGVEIIWSFANIAASLAYIYSKLFKLKTIIFSYEPHSQFMVDLGQWNRDSIKYRLLNFLEWRAGVKSNFVLTGTKYMVEELKARGAEGFIFRAPTSVDEKVFTVNTVLRKEYRKKLQVEDKKVLIYLGKFGGLYYDKEIYQLLSQLNSAIPEMFFVIATPQDQEEVKTEMLAVGLKNNFLITHLSHVQEVVGFLNAADIGLNAIPPKPSQKYRSPTKVAEYLLCGLPFITCRGVSEDDIYAEKYGVGVVLESFEKCHSLSKLFAIQELMNNRLSLAGKCREIGEEYRSKSNVVTQLRCIFGNLENIK